jgi:methyltransferase (TIGR00027 family)
LRPTGPSRTAEGAAFLRAWHACVDDAPLLWEEAELRLLLRPALRAVLRPPLPAARRALRIRERLRPETAALRGQVVLRSRWAEDALDAALARGVRQLVVLAAGLDTVALRRGDLPADATVFEVDHPATQAWKRARLGRRAPAVPALRWVPVDFARASLAEALREAGLDPTRPLFASWLGCSYYLDRTALSRTLAALGAVAAPGSEVVLDFWTPGAGLPIPQRLLLAGLRVAVALQQEPLTGLLAPQALDALAQAQRWRVAERLSPQAQRERWLAGRTDTLALPDFAWLARLQRD